ncbi:MAG: hypothetical protein QOK42_2731 [Frankiaceae bacterium]|jgi:hypothetical protein|nr:hypothetical protein [Frankiaceae bacterium]
MRLGAGAPHRWWHAVKFLPLGVVFLSCGGVDADRPNSATVHGRVTLADLLGTLKQAGLTCSGTDDIQQEALTSPGATFICGSPALQGAAVMQTAAGPADMEKRNLLAGEYAAHGRTWVVSFWSKGDLARFAKALSPLEGR